ncbi:AraC-type DNA-binding protein [Chitinophaga costaii]|uniref:AraC-type DNA-binding protein n=1 Tax=Chitinophaga costaii TaxID=1335309 RepID=A0A1C4FVS9_9BACT|nr:helix-turn-helix domain-containing protein [Chitinophaga costaii]PUZ27235.1 AraC family transcriptional regulator [Chitinophaga costaii]SCC59715.1 AraC-type DNA-binding protein [Chitinophaga costaii]
MNFHIYRPIASLNPFVKHYYYWQENVSGPVQVPHHLFALGDQYLLFIQEGSLSCTPAGHATFQLPPATILGHFSGAHQLHANGPVKMVAVQLNAYGSRKLLGLNMGTLTNYYRDLTKLDNPLWSELQTQLENLPMPKQLCACMNAALTTAMEQQHALKEVDQMADYIMKQNGNVTMCKLAELFQQSRHTLERKFMEVIGLPPMLFARMLRFKQTIKALQQMDHLQWQTALEQNGYPDAAAFVRDFLSFNGQPVNYFTYETESTAPVKNIVNMLLEQQQEVAVA